MDYARNKTNIDIDDFENVVRMSIEIISGDEILHILRKDYSEESYDSCSERIMNFSDDYYTIYDITKNINYIDDWNKRSSSYDYELKGE